MTGKILILGGGFIGQALARRLASLGRQVTVLTRRPPCTQIPGVAWQQGRLDDPAVMDKLLDDCDCVVHAASTSTPGQHAKAPATDAADNLLPLLYLLEQLTDRPNIPLIYLSSGGAIYGNPDTLPVTEANGLSPLSYHAAGKAAAEHFLGVFAHQGHPVTILRPANVYGPGQSVKQGFGVVPALLDHCKHGTTMTIWGDGESIRDYLYIDDLLSGITAVIDSPAYGIFNIGSGNGASLNRLCCLVENITGMPLQRVHLSPRSVDVRKIVLDTHRFCESFGWSQLVGIEQGIRATWDWLRSQ